MPTCTYVNSTPVSYGYDLSTNPNAVIMSVSSTSGVGQQYAGYTMSAYVYYLYSLVGFIPHTVGIATLTPLILNTTYLQLRCPQIKAQFASNSQFDLNTICVLARSDNF